MILSPHFRDNFAESVITEALNLHSLLNSQVLVLNRLWQAVNICSARRAFSLVYAGHAHVVSADDASNFLTHDFESWRDFSTDAPDHELVQTISRSEERRVGKE